MNEYIRQIVIGLILGDAYVTRSYGNSGRSMLDIKGDAKYLPYLKWLHRRLTSIGVSELKRKKGYHQYRFITKTSKEIGELRRIFYPNGVKTVPVSINSIFKSPLALAVWYQDDGHLDCRSKYHYNAIFATHGFSFESCQLLANVLRENFDLDVRIHKCTMRGKLYYKLYIASASMKHFAKLIEPYISSCFAYKIRKFV